MTDSVYAFCHFSVCFHFLGYFLSILLFFCYLQRLSIMQPKFGASDVCDMKFVSS